jgi:hypothetical protein
MGCKSITGGVMPAGIKIWVMIGVTFRRSRQMAAELEERVEDRLGKLESDVGHLQTDVTEIKADLRMLRAETHARFDKLIDRLDKTADRGSLDPLRDSVANLQERVTRGDLQTRTWMLLLTGTVLAVMAHGFKWI